jgi:hypothetical protein
MECASCRISGGVMHSLDIGHGYLLRVVGNLVQGRRLYAINGFGILPSTTLPGLAINRHICRYTVRSTQRKSLSSAGFPSRGIVTGAFLLVTASKDTSRRVRDMGHTRSHT